MIEHKAPFIFGALVIAALGAYIALFKSSPGELSQPHLAVAGSSFVSDCSKCHAGKDPAKNCLRCHTEILGQLEASRGLHAQLLAGKPPRCVPCHSEHNGRQFALVNKVSWGGKDPRAFSHAHVAYSLAGKHSALACEDCHEKKAKAFSLPQFPGRRRAHTFLGLTQTCIDCHQDIHAGGLAADCERCHGQNAFKPAAFFDHEKAFSLKERHAGLACKACHQIAAKSPGPRVTKRFPFEKAKGTGCADCHKDPHAARWKEKCESCHTAKAAPWALAGAIMTRPLHASTGFRLEAPHAKAACGQCHDSKLSFADRYGRRRRERDCESCHKDAHAGQFQASHPRCMDCHDAKAFLPPRFGAADHKTFALTGRHASAACNACHLKDRAGIRLFTPIRRDCAACHADAHFGQFKSGGSTRCENCHADASSWKKLVFDHNSQSRFKLDSAHKEVACKSCHPVVSLRAGGRTVQYKPLRMRCADCHEVGE